VTTALKVTCALIKNDGAVIGMILTPQQTETETELFCGNFKKGVRASVAEARFSDGRVIFADGAGKQACFTIEEKDGAELHALLANPRLRATHFYQTSPGLQITRIGMEKAGTTHTLPPFNL